MRLETNFTDAVTSFQNLLKANDYPTDVRWIFRDDIWKRTPSKVLLKHPSLLNEALAQKVFNEGCGKGLVEIHAVATTCDWIAATVWFPKFSNEEVQGWRGGMKLSIANPLPRARIVSPFLWWFLQLLPRFREYQQMEWTIGTKKWAAA